MMAFVQTSSDLDIVRALRKGRLRRGALEVLLRNGELTLEQLVSRLRSDRELVTWALLGKRGKFRETLSLVHLGLVSVHMRRAGLSVSLAARGRDVAKRLDAGWAP